jgi:Skp family chaperone for outer membrane proteins
VKRKVGIVVISAALGLAVYLGTRLTAGGAPGAKGPISKIGVVNLQLVVKKYQKFINLEKQLQDVTKKYRTKEEDIRTEMMGIQKDPKLSNEAKEQRLKAKKRELEDLAMDWKKKIGRQQEQELVQLYHEVEDMVARVAQYNGFEMILQYSDGTTEQERYSPGMIQRKSFPGTCVPAYVTKGLDISKQVYDNLNHYYKNPPKSRRRD